MSVPSPAPVKPVIAHPLNVIVATDCGSTTTKAILIEKIGDEYRQTYRGEEIGRASCRERVYSSV